MSERVVVVTAIDAMSGPMVEVLADVFADGNRWHVPVSATVPQGASIVDGEAPRLIINKCSGGTRFQCIHSDEELPGARTCPLGSICESKGSCAVVYES